MRLIFESGRSSVGPKREKSMGGTADADPLPAGALMTGPERTLRVNAVTSSLRIRPFGPEPVTSPRSTPSSRAKRRTDGLACTRRLPRTTSADGSAGGGLGSAGAAGSGGVGAGGSAGEVVAMVARVAVSGAGAAAGDVLAMTMRAALSATGAFCAPPAVFSGTGAADAPAAALSASVRILAPSEILSPIFTWMDWTVPA